LPEEAEVPLFAWASRWMLFEEGDNLPEQIQPIAHFKPITKAVIGPVIALDVNLTTSKEIP